MSKGFITTLEKTTKRVVLSELEKQNILNDDGIDAAAILLNTQTGHEWVIYGRKQIREKLDEQKIEVFEDPETKEVWREHTNVYTLVKQIKGNVLRKKQSEKTIEERIMEELGMTVEEAKEKLSKPEAPEEVPEAPEEVPKAPEEVKDDLIIKAKELGITGNLSMMKAETLQKKINSALESRIIED